MTARATTRPPRIGVASIVQETNTFSLAPTSLASFEAGAGIVLGEQMEPALAGTDTEAGGAIELLRERGAEPVGLLRAWAMSSGRMTAETLDALIELLRERLRASAPLDGLVLSLHGALAAEGSDDADGALLAAARAELGPRVPISVCLDLHANVTWTLVEQADALIGYHTYPHVDMAATGARAAALALDLATGARRPVTRVVKRPMLLPAEAQGPEGPFGALRATADAVTGGVVLDVSLFPVQPWLDVAELGFAVTVTTDDDPGVAQRVAEQLADLAWMRRHDFNVALATPAAAIAQARSAIRRPLLLSESSDSPTAGSSADSAAMVGALLRHGADLDALVTLVDGPAAAAAHAAGAGGAFDRRVGATIDARFHGPVTLTGTVERVGAGAVRLTGPVYHGTDVGLGRWAVVRAGRLRVLLTEAPAPTFDPETFRHAGLRPERSDLVVVRSATLYRAGWERLAGEAVLLDLPGPSSARLETLRFERAPRPLYPLDLP